MQTFLPYKNFRKSAECLDYRRLGKQRVEAWQILNTNIMYKAANQLNYKLGWVNHPAVKMWRGHELILCYYGATMCKEWIKRGYKDNLIDKFKKFYDDNYKLYKFEYFQGKLLPIIPKWLGHEIFHASHRSNLLRKDPVWYGKYGWIEPDTFKYYWPV